MLTISPLITALAAGNRVMIKVSEYTPATNLVLQSCLNDVFSHELVTIVEGEADIAAQFSSLPFDHLLFTGSTAVGKKVMQAAAHNLTPVTLELGGKSPALIAPDMAISEAVERLILGKVLNAGQICVSPDYVLVPKEKEQAFIDAYQQQFSQMFPSGVNSEHYTSLIHHAHLQRLIQLLDEAKVGGAEVIPANRYAIDSNEHKMVTHLVRNPPLNSTLMKEEIFGPILPIIGYEEVADAVRFINQRPRPLALYLFSHNKRLQREIAQITHAGGMAINETVFHVAAEDAPFGGIGMSGMGEYHGPEGFKTFSNSKTILKRGHFYPTRWLHPPYGKVHQWISKWLLR